MTMTYNQQGVNPNIIVNDLSDPLEIEKLTSSLLFLLPVRSQSALPYLLKQPQAHSNKEALTFWLTELLKTSDWVEPEELFEFCVRSLKRQLQSWQEVA